jgi:hypothetical protein
MVFSTRWLRKAALALSLVEEVALATVSKPSDRRDDVARKFFEQFLRTLVDKGF